MEALHPNTIRSIQKDADLGFAAWRIAKDRGLDEETVRAAIRGDCPTQESNLAPETLRGAAETLLERAKHLPAEQRERAIRCVRANFTEVFG